MCVHFPAVNAIRRRVVICAFSKSSPRNFWRYEGGEGRGFFLFFGCSRFSPCQRVVRGENSPLEVETCTQHCSFLSPQQQLSRTFRIWSASISRSPSFSPWELPVKLYSFAIAGRKLESTWWAGELCFRKVGGHKSLLDNLLRRTKLEEYGEV